MSVFGAGPLGGYQVQVIGGVPPEQTLRGAFLQLLVLQQQEDLEAELALLRHVPEGEELAIADLFAQGILARREELEAGLALRVDEGPRHVGESVAELREQVLEQDDSDGSAEGDPGEDEAVSPEPGSLEVALEPCALCRGTGFALTQRRGTCPRCDGQGKVRAKVDLVEQAENVAAHTLELAEGKDPAPSTVWHEFGRAQDAPYGKFCCSCSKAFRPCAAACKGPGDLWAHHSCLEAERARVNAERNAPPVTPELALALAAESMKPFKARHKPYVCRACACAHKEPPTGMACTKCGASVETVHPSCEICLKAIEVGAVARKKSRTSSKRMHDACVVRVLKGHDKQGATT